MNWMRTATMLPREEKAAKVERRLTEGHQCLLRRPPSLRPPPTKLKLRRMALGGPTGTRRMPPQRNAKPSPANSAGPAYDEQTTELKLLVDSLEKERDFYFSKLRDVEILCQIPEIEHLPIVNAI